MICCCESGCVMRCKFFIFKLRFKNDIIIFEREALNKYVLTLVKPSDTKYVYFENLIKENSVRGSHALIETLY